MKTNRYKNHRKAKDFKNENGEITGTFQCTYCKEIFTKVYSKLANLSSANKRNKHFCSHSCSANYQYENGNGTSESRDSAKYTQLKKQVRERENNKCQFCGISHEKKRKMHVHHISQDSSRFFDDSNCLLLCASCHIHLHHMIEKQQMKKER